MADVSPKAFGGAKLPRLRVLPTILFALLVTLAFASALPSPAADASGMAVFLSAWPMAMIAAPGLALAAFLALLSHPAVLWALLPLTGCLCFWISHDLPTAIFSLFWFLPAICLARLLERDVARVSAICRLSFVCGVVCLIPLYLNAGRSFGTFHPVELINIANDAMIELFASIRIADIDGTLIAYGEKQAAEIAQLMLLLLPGMTVLLCNLTAWAAHGLLLWLFRLHGMGQMLSPKVCELCLSRIAAVVFLFACGCSLLYGAGEPVGAFEAIGLNLLLVFEPAFAAIGFSAISASLRERSNLAKTLICAFSVFFLCGAGVCLLLIAFYGVIKTFRRSRAV